MSELSTEKWSNNRSVLGRIISEQFADELDRRGFCFVESSDGTPNSMSDDGRWIYDIHLSAYYPHGFTIIGLKRDGFTIIGLKRDGSLDITIQTFDVSVLPYTLSASDPELGTKFAKIVDAIMEESNGAQQRIKRNTD